MDLYKKHLYKKHPSRPLILGSTTALAPGRWILLPTRENILGSILRKDSGTLIDVTEYGVFSISSSSDLLEFYQTLA